MSRNADNVATTALLAFASGALAGAVAALLLAPVAGSETRRKLSDIQGGATDRLRRYAREAKYKMARRGKNGEDLQYDGGDAWI